MRESKHSALASRISARKNWSAHQQCAKSREGRYPRDTEGRSLFGCVLHSSVSEPCTGSGL